MALSLVNSKVVGHDFARSPHNMLLNPKEFQSIISA